MQVDDLDMAQIKTLEALQRIFPTVPKRKIAETFCESIQEARQVFWNYQDKGE